LLSDRWEAMVKAVQETMSRDARRIWRWQAPQMDTDALSTYAEPLPKPPAQQEVTEIAL
jgi:hypothetical protein